jgi:hypothetical protein
VHNLQISLLANWALVLGIIGEFISALCVRSVSYVLNVYFSEFNINVSLLICSFTLQVQQINRSKFSPFLFMFVFGSSTSSACLVFLGFYVLSQYLKSFNNPQGCYRIGVSSGFFLSCVFCVLS